MIDTFRGEYAFLSNFYNARIKYNGRTFMSSEAAFQSEKTLNEAEKDWFVGIGPVKAKALGRKVHLRPDWDDVKVKIMLDIVRAKFKQNAWLAKNCWQPETRNSSKATAMETISGAFLTAELEKTISAVY
jgi:predicted NAD-dependent protein-ADP-ribosyltransferase YbiA (DUF1768 family)